MSTEKRTAFGDVIPEALFTNRKIVFLESILLLIVVWSIIAQGFDLVGKISSPSLVAAYSVELVVSGRATPHVLDTLRRVLYGFVLTTIIGTVLGVVMGMSNFWRVALQDYVTVGLALPSLFAAVFTAMWFGISDVTPMVAAALIAFPFLTQNVYEGVKNIDFRLLEMSSAFGVSRNRAIRRVIIQSILPEWFAGARYSFAIAWKITTLAELVAAGSGIGFMIELEMQRLSLTGVIAWTALFTVIILIVEYGILQQIEKRVFDWREGSEIGMIGGV